MHGVILGVCVSLGCSMLTDSIVRGAAAALLIATGVAAAVGWL